MQARCRRRHHGDPEQGRIGRSRLDHRAGQGIGIELHQQRAVAVPARDVQRLDIIAAGIEGLEDVPHLHGNRHRRAPVEPAEAVEIAVERQAGNHPEGARLATFQRNPQFLWAHDQERLPIGTWLRVWVEDAKLKGEVQFATADLDAGGDVTKSFAEACWRMTKAGLLNAVSVFFVIHDAESNGDGLDVTD